MYVVAKNIKNKHPMMKFEFNYSKLNGVYFLKL